MIPDNSPDVEVLSVSFADEYVEIRYAESRDQAKNMSLLKTLTFMVSPETATEVNDVLEEVRELVDLLLDKARDVPDSIPGKVVR